MKYGQNFRFGFFDESPKERMRAIKEAGFDGVMLWFGNHFVKTDGSKNELVKLARNYSLQIDAFHSPTDLANYIWGEKTRSEQAVGLYLDVIHACEQNDCPSMVIHLTRKSRPPKFNKNGLEALSLVFEEADKCGINVAVENTRFLGYNDYVFSNLNFNSMKCCFDSGHNNCYTPNEDALAKYGDKVVLTHLHDNIGAGNVVCDLHNLMGEGTVDWAKRREQLLALNLKTIDLESYYHEGCSFGKMTKEEFLKLSFKRASDLMERNIIPE